MACLFVELMLGLFHTIRIQGGEHYFGDSIKCTFKIVLFSGSYDLIFKLGVMIDTT